MQRAALVWAALLAIAVAACNPTARATTTDLAPTPSADLPDGVIALTPLDVKVDAIAAGPEGVWLRSASGVVLAVDPATNAISARVDVPTSDFGAIAVGAGNVWLTDFAHSRLLRIDPAAKAISATIEVGINPEALLVTKDAIWVANNRGGSISKVDTATGTVVATYSFTKSGSKGPLGIVLAAGDLWTSVTNDRAVYRLDPTDGRVVAKVPNAAKSLRGPITDGRFVYVRTGDDSMVKIDPATNAAVNGFAPAVIPDVYARSSFWGATGRDLIRFDAITMSPAERWSVFPDAAETWPEYTMAVDGGIVWLVANQQRLLRIALSADG